MPEQKEKKPLTLQERLLEKSIKRIEKTVADRTEARLQMGDSPMQVLRNLYGSIGGVGTKSDTGLAPIIDELSKEQIPIERSQEGLIGTIGGMLQGKLVSPYAQRTQARGKEGAIDYLNKLINTQKNLQDVERQPIETLTALVDYAKKSGNRELLSILTQGSKEELSTEFPEISTSEIGKIGVGTGITEEGYFEIDPLTNDLTPQALRRKKEIEVKAMEDAQSLAKQGADLSEKKSNFGRVVSSLERAMSQLKGGMQENAAGSLMKGLSGDLRIFFKRPGVGRAASYDAQINETSLAMNNILTGQNRVIKGVVSMIKSTFPSRKAPEDQIAGLMAQTIENAYGIYKAFEKAGLTPDDLRLKTQQELNDINVRDLVARLQLTPEELQEREEFVNQVLSASPAQRRGLNFGSSSKEIENIDRELAEINRQLGVQ